jgi:hypothetical protein
MSAPAGRVAEIRNAVTLTLRNDDTTSLHHAAEHHLPDPLTNPAPEPLVAS